jgi:SAM-dependent methyltransferase
MPAFDFEDVFGDDYLHFYAPQLTDERSDREAELIARLLDLAPGMRVLDIACGHGRIANRLAALGCEVVGVDRSERFLEIARRAGQPVDFRRADVREYAPEGEFDRIVNWFTSFGYFDDATDRAILAGWRRALRPGGRLLLDQPNRQRLFQRLAVDGSTVALTERGDDLLVDRTRFDAATGRTETERISVRDGRVRRYRFSVRTFDLTELRGWLVDAGFARVAAYGGDGAEFDLRSARMIVVASV